MPVTRRDLAVAGERMCEADGGAAGEEKEKEGMIRRTVIMGQENKVRVEGHEYRVE